MTHLDSHDNGFKLALFTGSWAGRGEVFANPWSTATDCESHWQFGFDERGHHLIHDYHESRSDGSTFNGHGVFSLEPETKEILWFWFDSYGFPPLNPARGHWDGEKLTLIRKSLRGLGRSTFKFEHKRFSYAIDLQLPGEKTFSPLMRGEFTKIRTHF